jgi:hypothetical protein
MQLTAIDTEKLTAFEISGFVLMGITLWVSDICLCLEIGREKYLDVSCAFV